MKIAFFDSGIGGLTVLHHAMKELPEEQFIFFADEDHVPYGVKPKEKVREYVAEAFRYLMQQDVKAVVLACNTATSVAAEVMRRRYDIPIIGMEPAAKKAVDTYGDQRVLVTATPITVKGEKMRTLMKSMPKSGLVDLMPLPRLVEFAERQEFQSAQVTKYLRQEFAPFDFSRYSSIVLGCTHFNYFKDTMKELLPPHIRFVDGNEGTVQELIRRLKERNELEHLSQTVSYVYSGRPVEDPEELARIRRYLERLDQMYEI